MRECRPETGMFPVRSLRHARCNPKWAKHERHRLRRFHHVTSCPSEADNIRSCLLAFAHGNWEPRTIMREVILASSVRTPVGRAFKGTLRATRPDELAAVAIKGALERAPQLDPKEIEDVILGCAMPEAEQGMNVARIASLRAGLPVEVSAMTINRFCSSGLQAIAMAAERIMAGGAEIIVAGGTESMS